MKFVLGVDGGGSTTRVALVDEAGRVLGAGSSGPSNFHDIGLAATQRNIAEAVGQAWRQAALPERRCQAVFLGMAGVVSPTDRRDIAQLAAQLDLAPASLIGVDHDIRIALAGGLAGEEGIALIIGTGSSSYGRRHDGRDWRAGGWGHLLDDAGSAVFLGLQAMIAVVRAGDGRGRSTRLSESLMNALGLADLQDIMRALYHEQMSRARIAALAPIVVNAAAEGDAVARDIIARGTDELARMVEVVARQLEFVPRVVRVTVSGGVAENSGPAYRGPLEAAILRRVPTAILQPPRLQPVLGAALLALEACGIANQPALTDRLAESSREQTPVGAAVQAPP